VREKLWRWNRQQGGEHIVGAAVGEILLLAVPSVTKYFVQVKNRFLLIKCITMGALSFPTPFFIYFFLMDVDPNAISYGSRFLLIAVLLLGGAMVGLGSFYKDSAIAALKDWYPSEKPPTALLGSRRSPRRAR
jgi:hypothetical protein